MKSTKVFYMGKRLRDIYPHATAWQVFKYRVHKFFEKLFVLAIIGVIGYLIFLSGGYFNPKEVTLPPTQVIKEVEIEAPILDRIADCESGKRLPSGKAVKGSATHYDKNGQVLVQGNDNKTVDIGKNQINSYYWGAEATKLGYNLFIEEDNNAMAKYILKNRGTGDWSASESCWR